MCELNCMYFMKKKCCVPFYNPQMQPFALQKQSLRTLLTIHFLVQHGYVQI